MPLHGIVYICFAYHKSRDWPIMLIFYLLRYAPALKFLTYYAQYYARVKDLCLNFDCFIRVYSLVSQKF